MRWLILAFVLAACGTPPAAIAPTVAPPPTVAPLPTAPPSPEPSPEPSVRYLQYAREGAIPVVRPGLPAGEWKSLLVDRGAVSITFPLTVGTSNEQIVRLGKTQAQGIVKRLFDAAPELMSVNVIGTLPDGANQAELAAISIVVTRDALATWDGTPDTLGEWNVSPRLR